MVKEKLRMFENLNEHRINKSYLSNGYVIEKSEEKEALRQIRSVFIKNINRLLPKTKNKKDDFVLNNIHKFIDLKDLNSFN